MRSNVSIMRQLMSILDGLNVDDDAVRIEIDEHKAPFSGNNYRAATITLRNGDHITVRDDSSFDATNSNWDRIPLLSAGKT